MRDECKLMISKTVEFLFDWGFLKCMVSIHGLEFLDIELLEGKQSSNNLIRNTRRCLCVASIEKIAEECLIKSLFLQYHHLPTS